MLWALIITATLIPVGSQGGGGVSVSTMYGFQSEKACEDAGSKVPSPASNYWIKGSASFVCVPMGKSE